MKIALIGSRAKYFVSTIEYLNHTPFVYGHFEDVVYSNPDIAILVGCYDIVSKNYLKHFCPRGWYMFHESDLPEGCGHAPLQWTLINQIPRMTVSFLRVAETFDSGDIIGKQAYEIADGDTIKELRTISIRIENNMLIKYIPDIESGMLRTMAQEGERVYYPRRKPDDSELDINKTILEQWNLIRSCDSENYPAFFNINGRKFTVKLEG